MSEFGHKAWQSDSGLPQNTVHTIVQTRDGYLWAGTEGGLVRFDGVEFRVFDRGNTPALRSDVISALAEDAAGTLWVGTPAGLVSERGGVFRSWSSADGLPAVDVVGLGLSEREGLLALTPSGAARRQGDRFATIAGTERLGFGEGANLVASSADGGLWIAGADGVAALNKGGESRQCAATEPGCVQAIAVGSRGQLWVGGAHGLSSTGDARQTPAILNALLPSQDVTSLLIDSDGAAWIGTGRGLAIFAHGQMNTRSEFAGLRVQHLFADREGCVWVATGDRVARVTAGEVDFAPDGWSLSGVLSIFEDREGSMWFGTETGGLHVLREQPFFTISTGQGLSGSLVRAIFQDHTGAMWIGTSGGGLDRIVAGEASAGTATHYKAALPSRVVLAMAETHGAESDIWAGTPQGLVRIRRQQSRVFTTADGLADDFVRSLYPDRDGSLWIGTRNGLTHMVGTEFRSYSRLDGLASDLIGSILRSRDGTLWVGTLGGLSRMEGDRFVAGLPNTSPLALAAVTALLEDTTGGLWIGSQDRGLSRLKGGKLTSYASARTGLPGTIYGMLEDGAADLWLSSRTGVDRISIAALEAFSAQNHGRLRVAHFGAADGMRISEASGGGHPAAWRAHDGSLWFATLDGVAVVDPQQALRNTVAPLVAIDEVLVNDRPAGPALAKGSDPAPIKVRPGEGRITVQYAGLSFVAPQKVRYRYRLQGFDHGWVEAGARRTAYYTNVPPGSYRFQVMAANNDGVWSVTPAEARFAVEPYVYQTWWFYALLACGLCGLGYAGYRWRVHTVEAQLSSQYRAVLEERGRIAREIHDTLAQGYVAVSVQLELTDRLMQQSIEAARGQLRQTKELVREGLEEARSSIWNLRAQADAETLPALLAAHVSSLVLRRGAQQKEPVLKFAVHGAYRPLARKVEDEVRRVAQEAVANAMSHAHAKMISISLSYDADRLELQVVDDGVGINPSRPADTGRRHFGLQGMRERAEQIGAALEVGSGQGAGTEGAHKCQASGTTVRLQLQLPAAARRDAR